MINREQATVLLNLACSSNRQNTESVLEALYSGSDPGTREVLSQFPDLRARARELAEAKISVEQRRRDYVDVIGQLQRALNPVDYSSTNLSAPEENACERRD